MNIGLMVPSRHLLPFVFLLLVTLGCARAPAAPPPPVVRVDVWHDTVCPWCRIGLHNLDRVVADTKDVKVEVVHHPFLLDPEAPPEGRDFREHLGAKFGGVERLAPVFERVSAAGAPYGVRFDWAKVRVSPDSTASHTLIAWAPAERRAAVVDLVHRAHFEEGQNLGDVEVLVGIARQAGLDAAAARAAVTDATKRAQTKADALAAANAGIQGVPHFVIGAQVLSGAQAPEALSAAVRAALPKP